MELTNILEKLLRRLIICLLIVHFSTSCSNKQDKTQLIKNPVLEGFYPDPSITKGKDAYYMVNSSFAYYPGIPIFRSEDLCQWTQIGHILDRPDQLNLDGFGVSRGIFAPAIEFHNNTYYVVSTVVDGINNFIVHADNPKGPWSKPIAIPQIDGIDPSLFFEKDKCYIIYNSIAPNNQPLYDGHRTIRMFEFDINQFEVVGEEIILINGGSNLKSKPIWIEGPHIYKKDGYYYLMAAEGGTSIDHSEVIFRSKSIKGPYESHVDNPILTQRHLPIDRENAVTNTGHADLIKGPDGTWYAYFLGCRPYEGNHFNTGRETFVCKVKWDDEWPKFELDNGIVPSQVQFECINEIKDENPVFKDSFDHHNLNTRYCFLRTPISRWYTLKESKLLLDTRPETLYGNSNPSLICLRQDQKDFTYQVDLTFIPYNLSESAGLAVFQNEKHHVMISKSKDADLNDVIQLVKFEEEKYNILEEKKIKSDELKLKIECSQGQYQFSFCENEKWTQFTSTIDAKYFSTQTAGGFVGTMLGMYTTSNQTQTKTQNRAVFDNLTYQN